MREGEGGKLRNLEEWRPALARDRVSLSGETGSRLFGFFLRNRTSRDETCYLTGWYANVDDANGGGGGLLCLGWSNQIVRRDRGKKHQFAWCIMILLFLITQAICLTYGDFPDDEAK